MDHSQIVTIGSTAYRLVSVEGNRQWRAHATRVDTNERFGVEATGQSAEEAADRLTRWLQWQHEHMQALAELQQAERAYHRALAGAAFASTGGAAAAAESRAPLELVDAARARLDEIRVRRPSV